MLTYTSGTTGATKEAINTHGGLTFNSQTYREWMALDHDDVVLGIAPLFHITGLVGHVCLSLLLGAKLVLLHRFEGSVVLEAIREQQPTFTVGAITAFTNIAGQPTATKDDFRCFGPFTPAEHRSRLRFAMTSGLRTGMDINIYGMTETTSPTPCGAAGCLSTSRSRHGRRLHGVPVFSTIARVLGDDGAALPPEIGDWRSSSPK